MPIKGIKGGVGTKALGYGLGAAEEASEPHFNQTVLLLHSDGSEGEGNTSALGDPNFKAFIDNSTSAHPIVVQEETYGNDFSPHYYPDGYWSNSFFDDNFKVTTASDFDLASNQEFCIELFLNPYDGTAFGTPFYAFATSASPDDKFAIFTDASNNLDFRFAGAQIGTPFSLTLHTWTHIVITRDSSGYIRQFQDGVLKNYNQKTDAIDMAFATIGNRNGGVHYVGEISNLRYVKDSIPTTYQTSETSTGTTVFTSPTTPLTTSSQGATSSDVKLLTCQSNRFKDTSGNQTFTFSGTPKISVNTPFTQSKTANVGSGFFDGASDGLTTAGSSDFAFGTSDFTLEAWAYPFGTGGTQVIIDTRYSNNNNTDNLSSLVWFGSQLGSYSNGNIVSGTDIDLIAFAWNHLVVQRISNTMYYSINGKISSTTPSLSNNFSNTGAFPSIGGNVGLGASMFTGYLADVRIVNGTGVYGTSDFDVPTTSLTAVTNTKLLTCQYSGAVRNEGFVDSSKYRHRIARLGDVYHGTFTPFSLEDRYWSTYHDTATDAWVRFAGSGATDFNLDDEDSWCVEFFLYMEDNSVAYQRVAEQYSNSAYWAIKFDKDSNGTICIGATDTSDNGIIQSASAIPEHQWVHVAFTNDGSTLRLFVDGALSSSASSWTQPWTNASSGTPSIQLGNYRSINGYQTRGYISNFRLVKGSSVYTSAFTVPTSPLTAITNTVLLCSQGNRHLDNSTNGYTATSGAGTPPKIVPFSPFVPTRSYSKDAVGGSAYFDGTSDSLLVAGSSAETQPFKPKANQDFTFEAWVYLIGDPDSSEGSLIMGISEYGTSSDWILTINSSLIPELYLNATGTAYKGTTAITKNSWNHIAYSRSGTGSNNLKGFINGVNTSTHTTNSTTHSTGSTGLTLGADGANDEQLFQGYICNPRIINGTGLYTSAFTPPTAPLTAVTNTTFLGKFDNAGIIDHTMRNNLDTVNNVRIRTDIKKLGTGSIYFDGTDSIRWNQNNVQNEGMAIGTGPFTIEFFVYFDGDPNDGGTNGTASLIRDAGGNLVIQRYGGEWEAGNEATPQIQVAQSLSNQTWYHVAMTRDSSANLRLFIDGTQAGSTATSHTTDFSKNEWHLGALNASAAGGRALIGFMDEIRITAGVARYTSNFTAPTEPFANR